MTTSFIDAGVLIAAARGQGALAVAAIRLLDDPQRLFASSIFVQLEVLPKPLRYGRHAEAQFYKDYFAAVQRWADPTAICASALEIANEAGLGAIDALHVAAASLLKCDELITAEGTSKPLHRTSRVKVVAVVA